MKKFLLVCLFLILSYPVVAHDGPNDHFVKRQGDSWISGLLEVGPDVITLESNSASVGQYILNTHANAYLFGTGVDADNPLVSTADNQIILGIGGVQVFYIDSTGLSFFGDVITTGTVDASEYKLGGNDWIKPSPLDAFVDYFAAGLTGHRFRSDVTVTADILATTGTLSIGDIISASGVAVTAGAVEATNITGEQLSAIYSGSVKTTMTTDSGGDFYVSPSGKNFIVNRNIGATGQISSGGNIVSLSDILAALGSFIGQNLDINNAGEVAADIEEDLDVGNDIDIASDGHIGGNLVVDGTIIAGGGVTGGVIATGDITTTGTITALKFRTNAGKTWDAATVEAGQDGLYVRNTTGTAGLGNYGTGISFSPFETNRRVAGIAPRQGTADPDQVGLSWWTHPSATAGDPMVEGMRLTYDGNFDVPLGITGGTVAADSTVAAGSGVAVTKFSNDAFGSSGTVVPTEASVKTYIDAQIPSSVLDIVGNSGTGSVGLSTQSLTVSGATNEIATVASGSSIVVGLVTNPIVAGTLTANLVDSDTDLTAVSGIALGGTSSPDTNELQFGAASPKITIPSGTLSMVGAMDITTDLSANTVASDTTLAVQSGTTVNEFSIDGLLAGDSDDVLPTEKAVKTYVDTEITAQDLDIAGDAGTGAVDLDSQTLAIEGTTNEIETAVSGQTVTVGLPTDVTVAGDLDIGSTLTITGLLGVGIAAPLGKIHSFSGVSGTTPHAAGSGMVVEDNTNNGYSVLVPDASVGAYYFGSLANNLAAGLTHLYNNATLILTTRYTSGTISLRTANQIEGLGIDALQNVTIPNGTLDVVGASTAGSFASDSTLAAGSGTTINELSVDGTLAGNSDDALPTEKAVKTYADTLVTTQDLDIAGATGTGSVDLDSQVFTTTGTASQIVTAVSGQTVTISLPPDVVSTTFNGMTAGESATLTDGITSIGDKVHRHARLMSPDGTTTATYTENSGNVFMGQQLDIVGEASSDVGFSSPDGFFTGDHSILTSTFGRQLELAYDGSNETTFETDSGGLLIAIPSGGQSTFHGGFIIANAAAPANYTAFSTDGAGDITIAPQGEDMAVSGRLGITLGLTALTISTDSGIAVTKFSNDAFGSSGTVVPTEASVKTYIDAQVSSGSVEVSSGNIGTDDGFLYATRDGTDFSAPQLVISDGTDTATLQVNSGGALYIDNNDNQIITSSRFGPVARIAATYGPSSTDSIFSVEDTSGANPAAIIKNASVGTTSYAILTQAGSVTNNQQVIVCEGASGGALGSIQYLTSGTPGLAFVVPSDRNLKGGITTATVNYLIKFRETRMVEYYLKADLKKKRVTGFIAQEMAERFPELVSEHMVNGVLQKWIATTGLIYPMFGAIQELDTKVLRQDSQIADLTAAVLALTARLDAKENPRIIGTLNVTYPPGWNQLNSP